jgi:CubicO group peptidase (beta-lactamase class C family)
MPGHVANASERIELVQNNLLTYNVVRGEEQHTIEERLRFYHVPGVSIAVVDSGRIVWARGWGEVLAGSGVGVDSSTLFQAASISKPVTAAGALRLVERAALSLDEDVNTRFRSWHVPASRFTDSVKVTLRRLLSHTAGTTVHGFPGYVAGAQVPSPVQILDGAPPTNTARVVVDTFPGSVFRYSGGGYVIAQLLMTDVTGRPFPALMRELVLSRAGMAHSTFAQPLPAEREGEAATAHDRQDVPIPGRHHTYPEMSAAGLWTTPSDLTRFAMSIQRSLAGEVGALLSPEMAQLMITRQAASYGVGFTVEGSADSLWFSHGGSNAGFQSYLVASGTGGRGAAVMTNGDGGYELAIEVMRSIAREYDWGIFQPNERTAVEVHQPALKQFAGTYRADLPGQPGGLAIEIRLQDSHLRVDIPRVGWQGRSIRAAAPSRFFFLENPGELEFERNTGGAVTAVVVTGLGEPVRAARVNE